MLRCTTNVGGTSEKNSLCVKLFCDINPAPRRMSNRGQVVWQIGSQGGFNEHSQRRPIGSFRAGTRSRQPRARPVRACAAIEQRSGPRGGDRHGHQYSRRHADCLAVRQPRPRRARLHRSRDRERPRTHAAAGVHARCRRKPPRRVAGRRSEHHPDLGYQPARPRQRGDAAAGERTTDRARGRDQVAVRPQRHTRRCRGAHGSGARRCVRDLRLRCRRRRREHHHAQGLPGRRDDGALRPGRRAPTR